MRKSIKREANKPDRGPVKDETGKRYGKLVVTGRHGNTLTGQATWDCRCDCGNNTIVDGISLRRGDTRSCGCLVGRASLPVGEAAFHKVFRSIKLSAKRRGYAWELSREEALALMESNCDYCGVRPGNTCRGAEFNGEFHYSGIDRKDNSRGYVSGNVVPCCIDCNKAKSTRSVDEFLSWVDRLITFRLGKGQ